MSFVVAIMALASDALIVGVMLNETRTDPVSGFRSVHPNLSGKPLPSNQRIATADPDPCPFCLMGVDVQAGSASLNDGVSTRPLLQSSATAYAIANKWGMFGSDHAEIVTPLEHVPDLESLSVDAATDLFGLVFERHEKVAARNLNALAFINVGLQSGGSLTHLHAQVVGSPHPRSPLGEGFASADGISDDLSAARNRGLMVSEGHHGAVYVAPSPIVSGEVRVISSSLDGAARLSLATVQAIAGIAYWSYNVVIHPATDSTHRAGRPGQNLVQILPRFDLGIIYPMFLGTALSTLDQAAYAQNLSSRIGEQ